MKCKKCEVTFEFPDYKYFYETHWFYMGNGGWTNSSSGGPMLVEPKGKTAVCPFCEEPLYHGDINHYHNPDGTITDSPLGENYE